MPSVRWQKLNVVQAGQALEEHRKRVDHPRSFGDDSRAVLLVLMA